MTFLADSLAYICTMFGEFLRRLSAPDPDPLSGDDARLALASLLVRVARSDGQYLKEEVARIDQVLARRFELSPFEVVKLRGEAEVLETEAPDTVRFTRAIKNSVAYEERQQIIEALWEIVLADGERDAEEDSLMRMIGPMLGVNDRDNAHARQAVEQRR